MNAAPEGYEHTPIGLLPIEWQCTTIGKLCSVKRGASPRPISDPKWFGGNVGWVRISDATKSTKYLKSTVDFLSDAGVQKSVRVDVGEVILTICATIGVPIIVGTDVCIHDGFVWFDGLPKSVDREYWYYFLYSKTEEFRSHKQTGTQGNLNTAIVGGVSLGLPPRPEQKKIARILSSVDKKLALIDQQITATQTLKKGLMQKLFSEGVGTPDAKGQWQPHTEFQDTELGRIPKGWTVNALSSLIERLESGVSVNGEDRLKKDGEIAVLKISSVTYGKFDPRQHKVVIERDVHRAKLSPRKDRILVSRSNTEALVGASVYVNDDYPELFLPDKLWQTEPYHNAPLVMKWLSYVLSSPKVRDALSDMATGTSGSMKNITKGEFLGLSIALPSVAEQKEIAKILSTVDCKLARLATQKTQTQKLKKGLMQKLLTGQIRVQPEPQDR